MGIILHASHDPCEGKLRLNAEEDHIKYQQEVFQLLRENLAVAQNLMKRQAYQHHSEKHFQVWDWVFSRL
jgi:hypothetical protein